MRVPAVLALLCLLAATGHAEPTFGEFNAACGAPLFADENLWDDDVDSLVQRLKLPQESLTSNQSSYRLYPPPDALFLGARPFSISLLADDGKPSLVSLVFANKGDSVAGLAAGQGNRLVDVNRAELRGNRKAIEADAKTIEQALTDALGQPSAAKVGSGRETSEKVLRWDWKGHAFLLAAPRGEYVALRIMPSASADSDGSSRVPDSEMKTRLASRVEHRPNGDVVLRDIPMVDQGPKGYCVPATWERVMRYMGIPADMYVLAMAGGTQAGGGTSTADIAWAVKSAVTAAGRRMESPPVKLTPQGVARYIDEGLPVMWAMFSTEEFNTLADAHTQARNGVTDPESWSASLAGARKAAKKMRPDHEAGHVCMIIGYNEKTGELAVSDSWGPHFAERWVTAEEAQAVSQGRFYVISL